MASGFDWRSMVDQLSEVERSPQRALRTDQQTIQRRNDAYSVVKSQLASLMDKAKSLKDSTLFDTRSTASTSDTTATATATKTAAIGSYKFEVIQLATSSVHRGESDVGGALSSTNNVDGVALDASAFPTAITAGTFTVNGKKITVAATDTLRQVFDSISAATGGTVSATYSALTDKISLSATGGTKIVLGSANDTSNFLGVAQLSNNDTDTVTSSSKLGRIRLASVLSAANLNTAVSDGGSGAGKFKVNGVEISFNASVDTITDVLARVNNSTAGVVASYDPVNDRFSVANKVTGDLGVSIEDVTGNFLAATGILPGTLERGNNLRYKLNDGTDVLTSNSNTIDESSSGVTGLAVSVLAAGTTTISVDADNSQIKTAIKDFVAEYNKAQSTIDKYTASSTDEKGKVTAGVLAGDRDAFEISSQLRAMVNGQITGLGGSVDFLSDLGYASNSKDNQLSLSSESDLDNALAGNLSSIKEFFTASTTGLAAKVYTYTQRTADSDGVLDDKLSLLGKQVTDIDDQIAALERRVLASRDAMITSFISMETAQSNINQQLQFLNQKFGIS